MKEFLTEFTPSSDGDLLHLSEGATDFVGMSFLDMMPDKEDKESVDD